MRLRFQQNDKLGIYTIIEHIAGGGYGQVYRAVGPEGEHVAIKVVILQHIADARAGERLVMEVRSLKQLKHDNVVACRGQGATDDCVWVAMEYLHGETLQTRLERVGRLSIAATLRLMLDYCAGLAHMHEHGIVHRDIKPANLFIAAPDERGVLIDLGAARVGSGMNTTHKIGTPLFMPPDYIGSTGSQADPRWDVWALGAVAHLCIIGRHFLLEDGERAALVDPVKLVFRTCTWEAPPLASLVPGCPQRISDAIARCLVADPDARWPSCAAVGAELRACLEQHGAELPSSDELQMLPVIDLPPTGVAEAPDFAPTVQRTAAMRLDSGTQPLLLMHLAVERLVEWSALPAAAELGRALGEPPPQVANDEQASALMRKVVGHSLSRAGATMEGLLQHPNPWVKGAAAWLLIERGDARSLELAAGLEGRSDTPAWLRDLLERGRAHAARRGPRPPPQPAAGRAPDGSLGERPRRQNTTVGTLAGGLGRRPSDPETVAADLQSTMAQLRARALGQLHAQGYDAAHAFDALFRDVNPWVRASACWALIEHGEPHSLSRLRQNLDYDHAVLVRMVVEEAFKRFPMRTPNPSPVNSPAPAPALAGMAHPRAVMSGLYRWLAPLALGLCVLLAALVIVWWKWI